MLKKKAILVMMYFLVIIIPGCSMQEKSLSTYPNKPITIIVPYTAGGGPDMMARAMEKVAVKYLGQPLIVLNKPGGGATIGWNELASSKPDGYTIGYVASGALLQPLYGPTRYHYPTALEPLALVTYSPTSVVIRADQPWDNINDLIKYAKEHPGELKYGHGGLGTVTHVVGEMFVKEASVDIAQVPFLGPSESLAALLGGHIQMIFTAPPAAVKEYVTDGKVKVLAVAEEQRLTDPVFKNVPTFKEQKLDVVFSLWYGVGAPKDLPKDVNSRLVEGLKGIIQDPDFQKNMEDLGMRAEYLGPQEFSQKWNYDSAQLSRIIKETGMAERIASQKK